jgi:hypothetical protein
MTGDLNMNDNFIKNLPVAQEDGDPVSLETLRLLGLISNAGDGFFSGLLSTSTIPILGGLV